MEDNLVIVESPAKAKTIEKFLGKDFHVTSSFGHIRDLEKKNLGIDLTKAYEPQYVVPEDKKKRVSELKKLAKEAKVVWLASDEDREGEAIAWHLYEELGLTKEKTRRIVFNEITKEAILHAIKNPREIDQALVNAQQARRVLDRLVGFELSPVLWKKVRPSLSAGRVQSVAVRLLVDREREIRSFRSESSYKTTGTFNVTGEPAAELQADLDRRFETKEEANAFLTDCIEAVFQVSGVSTRPGKKSPAPPFTTSTLQQEAARKLGFSVAQTMSVAQKLYEAGKITYMRTDSVNLSDMALGLARKTIEATFGPEYSQTRKYKTKTKGAQEAHEAIRPTYLDNREIPGTPQEKRLYDLIWKRTVASQMSDASVEKTTITIDISTRSEKFLAVGEVLLFDGFLKVYSESTDEESDEERTSLLPPVKSGDLLGSDEITATQKYSQSPPRYTEASLVKKLEELGIGRPSTYAPTISTIQQRGYVIKESREGKPRESTILILRKKSIRETQKQEMAGAEKNKLFPDDIGIVVTDFLMEYFSDILDYHFTAEVEKQFDEIAEGQLEWHSMIDTFYVPFHKQVVDTVEHSEKAGGDRVLGTDPASGKPIIVRIGRFGPMAQIGSTSDEEKPRFAGLLKGQHLETITLEEALALFRLPRKLGVFEEKEITVGTGRFGPYLYHSAKYYSINNKDDNPLEIGMERAIEVIQEKREADKNKVIKQFSEEPSVQILNGRWGPYIAKGKENYKIPKSQNPAELTLEACIHIIEAAGKPGKTGKNGKSAGAKTATRTKTAATGTKTATKAKAVAGDKTTATGAKTTAKRISKKS